MILIYAPFHCDHRSGGIVVLYYLASLLKKKGLDVKIYNTSPNKNEFFSEFTTTFDNENTVVIYPEVIYNNPLNAKNVIRWILAEVGKNTTADINKTWGKNDLCYYFLSEKKIKESPEKLTSVYKFLTTIYLKPNTFKNMKKPRSGHCHIFKKHHYHKTLTPFHPKDSVLVEFSTHDELVEIFNKYEYFICYDPACFLIWIAGLCGCIPILHKMENITKKDYFTGQSEANSNLYLYYLNHKYTDYPGIAYGEEDVEHAKQTIHLLPDLLNKQIEYTNDYCINQFIRDVENFDKNKNTIEANYIS